MPASEPVSSAKGVETPRILIRAFRYRDQILDHNNPGLVPLHSKPRLQWETA